MSQQLVKKGANGRIVNVNPRSWIEAIKDKNTGQTLVEILQGFNMYFLPYNGNTSSTRCLVPAMLRKKGLWITYVKYDGNVYTEWYAADELDDKSWGDSSNWRIGNNTLVGDITISANGNWVINGTETEFKAVGEKGNTPLLRVANNRLQVSYDLGDTYRDVTNNPVYTKFRWYGTTGDTQANNVGRIQASTDEGKTWTNMSNDFTNNLHISRYIGVNESLPTSGIAEGTIYAKGPYYAEDDTLNDNPIYRLWVYAWKGNTLAWQDNGEFQSIAAGIVQETGDSETEVMSQKAVTTKLTELGSEAKLLSDKFIDCSNEHVSLLFKELYINKGDNWNKITHFYTIRYENRTDLKFSIDNIYAYSVSVPDDYNGSILPIIKNNDSTKNLIYGYCIIEKNEILDNTSSYIPIKIRNTSFELNASPSIRGMFDLISKPYTNVDVVNSIIKELFILDKTFKEQVTGIAIIEYSTYANVNFIDASNKYISSVTVKNDSDILSITADGNIVGYFSIRINSPYFGDIRVGKTHVFNIQLNNICLEESENPFISSIINNIGISDNKNFNDLCKELVYFDMSLLNGVKEYVVLGYGTHCDIRFSDGVTPYVNNIRVYPDTKNTDVLEITNINRDSVIGYAVINVNDSVYGDIINSSVTVKENFILNKKKLNLVDNNYINTYLKISAKDQSKTIVCFGDSITRMGYPESLKSLIGGRIVNAAIGGTRLANTKGYTTVQEQVTKLSICNMIQYFCENTWTEANQAAAIWKEETGSDIPSLIAEVQTINVSDVDYIIIMGGTNDINVTTPGDINSYDEMTLYGALNSSIRRLMQANPNLQILVMSPTVEQFGSGEQLNDINYFSDTYKGAQGISKLDMANSFREIAKNNHVSFGDMYNDLGCNFYNLSAYFNSNDYVHPRKAVDKMARIVASYINTKMY